MEHRFLGASGFKVPVLSLGTGTFGGEAVSFGDVIAMMGEHDRGHREEIEHLIDRLEER